MRQAVTLLCQIIYCISGCTVAPVWQHGFVLFLAASMVNKAVCEKPYITSLETSWVLLLTTGMPSSGI
jgi:hypothetical protein